MINENETGEICVAGESTAVEYFNAPELSFEKLNFAIAGYPDKKFIRTGDIGFILDNELFITGRIKDMIIIRGRNIFPEDIEIEIKNGLNNKDILETAAFSINKNSEEKIIDKI